MTMECVLVGLSYLLTCLAFLGCAPVGIEDRAWFLVAETRQRERVRNRTAGAILFTGVCT